MSLHNNAVVASSMYHIIFVKTENIAVDEIERITSIYKQLLARVHTYFYMKLLCMHDTVTCIIVAL